MTAPKMANATRHPTICTRAGSERQRRRVGRESGTRRTHAEEPPEAIDALARDVHVHAPQTGDQVHLRAMRACAHGVSVGLPRREEGGGASARTYGDEDGTERRQLGQDIVDLVVGVRHLDRDLGEVVGVRARQDLLVVRQVLRARRDVVLDVRQVETLCVRVGRQSAKPERNVESRVRTHNVRLWRDRPVLVAALRESLDDVGLVAHEAQQTHDLLAASADPANEKARSARVPPRQEERAIPKRRTSGACRSARPP